MHAMSGAHSRTHTRQQTLGMHYAILHSQHRKDQSISCDFRQKSVANRNWKKLHTITCEKTRPFVSYTWNFKKRFELLLKMTQLCGVERTNWRQHLITEKECAYTCDTIDLNAFCIGASPRSYLQLLSTNWKQKLERCIFVICIDHRWDNGTF